MLRIMGQAMFLLFAINTLCNAQFRDDFNGEKIEGWFFFTGDGYAKMDFVQKNGFAQMLIDATQDRDNVYWTLIKRDVTASLDLRALKDTSYELRVEARVRVHNAPRRLNFMVNTQRTTDYHKDLMEFDIPDTTDWHVISMTTRRFDAHPGDTVYVQLCATDYGLGKHAVDIDYYRADIVNVKTAGPDKGEQVPYHPPIPEVSHFSNHLTASQDALINSDFHDVNFNNWHVSESGKTTPTLMLNANQWAILRWDFSAFKNTPIDEAGILELTTQSVSQGGNYNAAYGEDFGMEFGKVRVIEITGGDPSWDQKLVTFDNLTRGLPYDQVFNTQMIYDADVTVERGGKTYIVISKPVLQRLIDGTTKGLLIRPLGAIDASFYAAEIAGNNGPVLHFNTK